MSNLKAPTTRKGLLNFNEKRTNCFLSEMIISSLIAKNEYTVTFRFFLFLLFRNKSMSNGSMSWKLISQWKTVFFK